MADVEGQTGRLLRTTPAASVRSAAVHFFPGDVLYGRLRPYLNKVLSADFEGVSSAEFIPLTPAVGVSSRFLQYRLLSGDFVHFASHLNTGDRPRVDFEQIASFPIALPPSQEQRRIVSTIESYLSRLDEAVTLLERTLRNLKRYRFAVLKGAVEGRLVPTEAELARTEGRDYEPADALLKRILAERRQRSEEAEMGGATTACRPSADRRKARHQEPVGHDGRDLWPLPEGWCWASVDMVGEVVLGRQRAPQYLTGRFAHPYLRVANIKDDALDLSDVESMDFDPRHFAKYRLLPGDILISEGQSPELVGQSAIYRGGIEGLCFQKTLHRFRPLPLGPSSKFAQLVLRSHVKSGVFLRRAAITTNIAHLTLEKFRATPFPLPPAREQARILAEAERLLSAADAAEAIVHRQLLGSRRLRRAVLHWAFEGKLVDRDAADEPASVLFQRIRLETAAVRTHEDRGGEKPRAGKRRMRSRTEEAAH